MSHRFVTEAVNLPVFDKGQIEVGGGFRIEGETFSNLALR